MDPTEGRRSRQDDDVAWLEAVHSLAIGVESDEPLVVINRQLFTAAEVFVQQIEAVFEPVVKDVGHRNQLDGSVLCRECVCRRPRATTAATDKSNLDGVALPCVNERGCRLRKGRGRRDYATGLDEVTTGRGRLRIGHGVTPARGAGSRALSHEDDGGPPFNIF